MMTIYGKYTNAIVYADIIDKETKKSNKSLNRPRIYERYKSSYYG